MNGKEISGAAAKFVSAKSGALAQRLSERSTYVVGCGFDFDLFTAPLVDDAKFDQVGVASISLQQVQPTDVDEDVPRFTIPFEYIEPVEAGAFVLLICQSVIAIERETSALMTRVISALGREPEMIYLFSSTVSERARRELIRRHSTLSGASFLTPPPVPDDVARSVRTTLFNHLDRRGRASSPIMPRWVRSRLRESEYDPKNTL